MFVLWYTIDTGVYNEHQCRVAIVAGIPLPFVVQYVDCCSMFNVQSFFGIWLF
jgi:hypothetical protein